MKKPIGMNIKNCAPAKVGELVLVRDAIVDRWIVTRLVEYREHDFNPYVSFRDVSWRFCIPLKGNEHLAYPLESPKELQELEGVKGLEGSEVCHTVKDLHKKDAKGHLWKPFDKMLVRDNPTSAWQPTLFSFYRESDWPYIGIDGEGYREAIPYEGNEEFCWRVGEPNEDSK